MNRAVPKPINPIFCEAINRYYIKSISLFLCTDDEFESAMDFDRFQRLLSLASQEEAEGQSSQGAAGVDTEAADALLHQLAAKLGLDPRQR